MNTVANAEKREAENVSGRSTVDGVGVEPVALGFAASLDGTGIARVCWVFVRAWAGRRPDARGCARSLWMVTLTPAVCTKAVELLEAPPNRARPLVPVAFFFQPFGMTWNVELELGAGAGAAASARVRVGAQWVRTVLSCGR